MNHRQEDVTYRTLLNPELAVHDVYSSRVYIPDFTRTAFSRLRLMSHNLRIETGRWSRTPTELRLCDCGERRVQDEAHVLLECPMSNDCRLGFEMLNFASFQGLMNEREQCDKLCKYVHKVLNVYQ